MDDSGAFHSGHSGEKNRDALPSSDEFVSFMDDLNKRTDFTEVPGDSGFADNGGDLFAGVEPLPCHESHSVFSPTTVASEELHDKHGPEHFGVVIPANSSGSRGEPTVNFDNALNVAFNSTVQEQPKQIWETGIWKYIFGNDDSELDFDVWGRPLKRPIPAVWGVDQSSLDKEPTGVLKRSRFQSCNFMDVVSFKPDVPPPLGETKGKLTYRGASSFGLQSQAGGMMVALWFADWVRCATRPKSSTCLHMFFQEGRQ